MTIYLSELPYLKPSEINQATPWRRPADWLTLPTVEATDQVFYGLHAVFDNSSNFATVYAIGAYTVDWGDGSAPIDMASGTTAYYNYDYNAVGLDGTLTTRGYKQAIVTITPQAGQTLSNINLSVKHNQTGLANGTDSQWLDIRLAMNNTGTVSMYNSNWRHKYLEQFEWVGSNSQTNFSNMFQFCYSLQSIPQLDTSSGTDFRYMFSYCNSLQSIPQLDTSSGTNFSYMFQNCNSLQSISLLDTSSGTNFRYMFGDCSSLQSIPQLDTSSGTNFSYMFGGCNSLQSIPQLDTSSGTSFSDMFRSCNSLQSIPQLDTSRGTNFDRMFQNCNSLQSISLLDTSSGTGFSDMFSYCNSLQSIPQLDTSSGTDFRYMFSYCNSLQTIPQLDTSSGTNFSYMFQNCNSLQSISLLDTSSGTGFSNMFLYSYSLSRIQATFPNNQSFTIANCSLGPDELNELYTNLPLGGTSTITVTGNWGVNEPSHDPTIATAKGYTIVT